MAVTTDMIKQLREQTGAGMMDCKKALEATDGDLDKAVEELRKKGMAKAAKKAGREASEGLISSYIHAGGKIGVLIEVNCETDFVARTDEFRDFVYDLAMHIAASNPVAVAGDDIDADTLARERRIYREQALEEGKPENIVDKIVEGKVQKFLKENALLDQEFVKDPDTTVAAYIEETVGKLGENIVVRRFARFELGAAQ